MPIWGTGPQRTDGQTNPQINATILYYSSPNQIANLSLWFDATDNTTIQLQQGNSSNITGWTSKGNVPIQISTIAVVAPLTPNNAVLPYTVPNALNGRQTIFMNGVSSMLQFTSSIRNSALVTNNETTIFTVANPTNAVSNNILFAYDFSFFNRIVYQINFPGAGLSFFYGNGVAPTFTGGSGGTYYGLGYYQNTVYRRSSDTSIAIKFRGSILNSNSNSVLMNTNSHFGIGGGPGHGQPTTFNNAFPYYNTLPRFFTGNIAEILWYNRGLTDDEIVSVEGYLAKKWGIQNQLRFNHVGVARNPPLMGYRLLSYPTAPASNAALWFDTMDTATMSNTVGRAPPNNLDFVQNMRDKASGCNAFTTRWPVFDLYAWGYKPTLKYIHLNPNNARFLGTPPFYRGSTLSMFLVVNAGLTPAGLGSNIVTIGEDAGNPLSRGLSIYVRNNSTIGIQRGVNLISSFYQTGSNILVSAFVNGNNFTTGGLPPSTTALYFNGSLVASTPTPSSISTFNMINYCMGGNNNFQDFQGNISEWLVFYRTLTSAEINNVHSVMLPKWSLPSNAPITYINSLPVTSGLFGWYDAYDQTTVLRNRSNNVSMWLDKSGQNNHMSTNLLTYGSNTGSNIYYSSVSISTNQFPSLFFPSTFAFMQTSTLITNQNLSSMTMIAVKRGRKIVNGPQLRTVSLFSTLGQLERAGGVIGATVNQFYDYNISNTQLTSNFSTFHINTLVGNVGPSAENGVASRTAVTYYNGGNAQTTTSLAYVGNLYPSYMRLMNGPYNDIFNGDVRTDSGYLGEVLLYNRILNSNELFNTHTYLLNKWGISTLVSNVPVTRGLNLWLDAYDPLTVTFSTNTTQVTQWRDKSISSLHFSNALTNNGIRIPSYTTNPANSLPGLLFSNTTPTNPYATGLYNCNFNYPVTREATIFTVAQWSSGNASFYSPVFCMLSNNEFVNNTANSFTVTGPANGLNVNLYRSSPGAFLTNIANTLDRPTLVTGVFNSSFTTTVIPDIPQNNIAVGRNGVIGSRSISSFISTLGNGLHIRSVDFNVNQAVLGLRAPAGGDGTWYHSGYIHEVLLYNRTLAFSERQQVESYLMSKWRI